MVERTGLSLLCLSERGGVPRMCVGGFSLERNFVNKAVESCPSLSLLGVYPVVEQTGLSLL